MTTPDPSIPAAPQGTPIPLPAAAAPPSPAAGASWRQGLVDLLLASVVLLFAFLTASTAVRNSDFWMHLAGGRLLAERQYTFGVDPFAYTTEGVYWANHSWLFDLLLYLGHRQLGGVVLVVIKAALIACLAALMLTIGRPDRRIGVPALCTLLAMLAMSPRLLLHATCLSYVFLGLTFWLLGRPSLEAPSPRQRLRRFIALLVLFVLWVNVDDWFLLGPLLVALFWLGERLTPRRGEEGPRMPGGLVPMALAVCLLNPHTWHAFTLPTDLLPLPVALRHDPRFARLSASPWQLSLLYHPVSGLNLATAAYFVLLGLGALSFLLVVRRIVGWRLLVWLSFAGLSAWLARAVPFFAVVAGPITALNLQDYLHAAEQGARPQRRFLRGAASFVLLGLGLALSLLAWMGWLRGFASVGRGVDWSVQPDSSLQRVAETLHLWHEQGKLHEKNHGFPVHPSVVHYCAWFCPEERGFLDQRLPLFAAVAGDYETVCRALNPGLARSSGPPAGDWKAILRRHGVNHVILYDPDMPRLMPALKRLADDDTDETLVHLDGQALILGWKDGARRVPANLRVFDAERLAFAPAGAEDVRMLPPAPRHGAARGPRPADLWSHLDRPIPPPSWGSDTAGVLLHYFEDRAPQQFRLRVTHCLGWAAALSAVPASCAGPVDASLRLAMLLERMPPAPEDLGQRPSALPLLAVRAARRGVADNPDDASAYLYLGRAYLALAGLTAERVALGAFPPLARLRQIQIASALESALRRNPDLEPAHEDLANLYVSRNFLDAALEHRREAGRLTRRTGPLGGETAEAFARRLEQMESGTRDLEREVGDRRNRFTLQAQTLGSQPYRKAQLALRLGLARLALEDVLMQSSMVLLGGEGVALQMELQLLLGRAEPVREQLQEPDWQANKKNLGHLEFRIGAEANGPPAYRLPAYDWLFVCQAAAMGDYEQAETSLQTLRDSLGGQRAIDNARNLRRDLSRAVAQELAVFSTPRSWLPLPRQLARENRQLMAEAAAALSYMVREQADLHVVSAMLSLERGLPRSAEESLKTSRALSDLVSVPGPATSGQSLAAMYRRILQAARR